VSLPRPRDPFGVVLGVAYLGVGLLGVLHHHGLGIVFLGLGVVYVLKGLLTTPPAAMSSDRGPGSLAPTPTGRFRATGWPPSKNPDDYR
jgi:hypothetical protein